MSWFAASGAYNCQYKDCRTGHIHKTVSPTIGKMWLMFETQGQIPEGLVRGHCKKRLSPPQPVKLFMGLIYRQGINLEETKRELAENFGEFQIESRPYPFDHTDYYNEEMGSPLIRSFVGFKRCIHPDELAEIKLTTNQIEARMGRLDGEKFSRSANLDPGVLSLSNIILATTKNRAHRIYLGKGIYAEVTLMYSKSKGWFPLNWTYPDYRTSETIEFFTRLRDIYQTQDTRTSRNQKASGIL